MRLNKFKSEINKKDIVAILVIVFISLIIVFVGVIAFDTDDSQSDGTEMVTARIIEVTDVSENTTTYEEGLSTTQTESTFTAKILEGEYDGEVITGIQSLDTTYAIQDIPVEEGDKILITMVSDGFTGEDIWYFASYDRVNTSLILVLVFFILLIIIGRRQGITTILSLALTCLMIFLVYLPAILYGVNVYLATSLICIYLIIMSLTIIGGFNKKTGSAILGNIGGVVIAATLAYFLNEHMKMTGFVDDTYAFLTVSGGGSIDLVAILWSGIVLGSLGAIMDVAMSISSAMNELDVHMKDKTFKKLIKSGMNIGRDAIGTMTNTLVLAYMGGSIALVLLLMLNTKDVTYLFSLEMIVEQVVQSVVGSMGILFAVPFTAVFSAYIFMKSSQKNDKLEKTQDITHR